MGLRLRPIQFRVAQFRLEAGLPIQSIPFALFGGQAEPSVGFHFILGDAGTGQMEHREAGLRRDVALEGGLAQQVGGSSVVPMRLQRVVAAQFKLGGGVPLSSGLSDPAQGGLFVGRNALAGDVAHSQFQLGGSIAGHSALVERGQSGRNGVAGIEAGGEAEAQQQEDKAAAGIQWTFRRVSAGAFSRLSISAATAYAICAGVYLAAQNVIGQSAK